MKLHETLRRLGKTCFGEAFLSTTVQDVDRVLGGDIRTERDLLVLLSPAAEQRLEAMAQVSHELTLRHFGRTIQIFTPLYVSDHCVNQCLYCSFSAKNRFPRRKLTLAKIEREAATIAATGMKHVLLLTGESRLESPVTYLRDCVRVLKRHFHSIGLEVYPLEEAEYSDLVEAGVDSLTIYQETYDEADYARIHPHGPKKDYRYRLEAPERGARAGMRQVNIGALHGLGDWRVEAFLTAMHARELQDHFSHLELGISLPRLRPHAGDFHSRVVSDRHFVQMLTALRLFMPRLGISLSTRETPSFRDHLVPLGITRMSAGVSTQVGGRSEDVDSEAATPQFEIADHRGVAEISNMLRAKGYDPVMTDWLGDPPKGFGLDLSVDSGWSAQSATESMPGG